MQSLHRPTRLKHSYNPTAIHQYGLMALTGELVHIAMCKLRAYMRYKRIKQITQR